jgi:phosphate/sulfate permease
MGLPISSTHCKVGSVVAVGWAQQSEQGVQWGTFRNIFMSWVITLPATGILEGVVFVIKII